MRLLAGVLRFLKRDRFAVKLLVLNPFLDLKCEFGSDVALRVLKGDASLTQRMRMFCAIQEEAIEHDILVGYAELTPTYLTALAGYLRRKPVIGWVHISLLQVFKLKLRPHAAHRFFLTLIYPRLTRVIGVSEGVSNELKSAFGLKNVTCIRNCIDVEEVQRLAAEPLPKGLKSIFERPVLINVGVLGYQKAQDVLIAAHSRLMAEGLLHNLLLVGEGPSKKELELLARDLFVEASVHFAGLLKNPYPVMARSKAFVLSSRFEGFGLVLVEALALGLPVVATDCDSGPREILENGRYGLLASPNDPSALAAAMKRILIDGELASLLRQRGYQRAWHYDCGEVVPQVQLLFDAVARSKP
jgi:glycosyltransferase involved in cell wall biosynthesis